MSRMEALYPTSTDSPRLLKAVRQLTHQTVNPMEDNDLQALMARLELLIGRVEQLKSQNALLLAQEKTWREERAHLIEKTKSPGVRSNR